jgi:hypothetical protein
MLPIARLVSAVLLTISTMGTATARPAELGANCSLGIRYPVTAVKPYRSEDAAGYAAMGRTFRGADIYIVAQPGMTREWLQRRMESEIGTDTCDFGVSRPTVDVISAGGGFLVRVSGPNEAAANEILTRAELLIR